MVASAREMEAAGHAPRAFVGTAVICAALAACWGVVAVEASVEARAEQGVGEYLTVALAQAISPGEASPNAGPESRQENSTTADEADEQPGPVLPDREDSVEPEAQAAPEVEAKPAEEAAEVAKPIPGRDVPAGNRLQAGLLVAAVLGALFVAMRFVLRAR